MCIQLYTNRINTEALEAKHKNYPPVTTVWPLSQEKKVNLPGNPGIPSRPGGPGEP